MAATGTFIFSPVAVLCASSTTTTTSFFSNKLNLKPHNPLRFSAVASDKINAETARNSTPISANNLTKLDKKSIEEEATEAYYKGDEKGSAKNDNNNNNSKNPYVLALKGEVVEMEGRRSFKNYLEESMEFVARPADGGPPRWFSPLECGSRFDNSPLLLFLPGIIGVGLELSTQNHAMGKMFDIWCLHIPPKDRTSFRGLVQLVERTVRSEYKRAPNKPIYLVAESLGACLALAVAARNPDIDLVLILANPATSFDRLSLQPLLTRLLEFVPYQLLLFSLPNFSNLVTDDLVRKTMEDVVKRFVPQAAVQGLVEEAATISSYLSVLGNVFTKETLLWKLEMLKSASAYANSRLHSIKAQTLVLSSGRDQLLPSEEEGRRLRRVMPNCDIRCFPNTGHQLFLEDDINLATIIKGASFYRRGRKHDYVADYVQATPSEFKNLYHSYKWFEQITSPVMVSTLEDGKIVKGLAGIPSEGPVLIVGYHSLMGLELLPLMPQLMLERNILLRGLAHPVLFMRHKGGNLPPMSDFDVIRVLGAVPVTGSNFYKLMSSKSHAILYPGGVREACHRKGEEYMLHWPEQAEFIRIAATFGAKIVPFGTVGEDDVAELVLDYDDQMRIPFMRDYIKSLRDEAINVRPEGRGEVANQDMHWPVLLPKIPGRYYLSFGKPIETEGRKEELRDKEKAHELYLQVKSEVYNCIDFVKRKRESDPYRNILARITYQATHGLTCEVPSFDL